MSNKEIERRFLVKTLPPDLHKYRYKKISQSYLHISDNLEIRLRKEISDYGSASHYLTIKQGNGKIRQEYQTALNTFQFDDLWPAISGQTLQKIRYFIPHQDVLVVELNCYSQALNNLIIAEVEFKSEEACDNFVPPSWFGEEVTDRPEYQNKHLIMQVGIK